MEKLRILVADDESIRVMTLTAQLEAMGHQVIGEAATGEQAVELARELKPDLAIMDIKMPGMDGIEAARAITKERPLPVLLMTAFGERELAERAAEAGIFAYLMKPVSEEELLPSMILAQARFKEFELLRKEVDSLREALETRKRVERAKGILMERLNLTEEEAFRRMQRRSQNENKKLGDVAEAIIMASKMF